MFHWRSKVSALWLHARTKLHDRIWSLYTETRYSSVHSTSICFTIQTNKEDTETKKKRVWNHFSSSGSNTKASFKTNYTIYIYIYIITHCLTEMISEGFKRKWSLKRCKLTLCFCFYMLSVNSFWTICQVLLFFSRTSQTFPEEVFSSFYVKVSII